MKLVYVAGPFRGETPWDVERNVHAAECVALEVGRHGAVPVCPHTMWRHFDKTLPDSFWLRACGDLLRKCDAMVRFKGWQDSVGTCAESALASELGMRIIDWESPTASLELATWLGEGVVCANPLREPCREPCVDCPGQGLLTWPTK